MKLNKKAFTLTELMICMAIMMAVAFVAIATIKPNDNKIKVYAYAGMSALSAALGTIAAQDSGISDTNITYGGETYDWLCAKMVDYFAIEELANCKVTASESTVNFTLPNGITIQGLARPWATEDKSSVGGEIYTYKEIVFDIDGPSKGMNKVGIDRFPVRIYKDGLVKGTIIPSDCSATTVGNFCKNGTVKSGVNLAKAAETINYEIYRQNDTSSAKASLIAAYKSYMEADCGIFGGLGYYSRLECSNAGYNVILKCTTETICGSCVSGGVNICATYNGSKLRETNCTTGAAAVNPNNFGCIMMLTRPSSGAGIMIDAMSDVNLKSAY